MVLTLSLATELGLDSSPYMSFAPRLDDVTCRRLRPIAHVDGTCRIQTLSPEDDAELYAAVLAAERAGRVVVNTSLNLRRQPLIEFPHQALDLFQSESAIDVLYSGYERWARS